MNKAGLRLSISLKAFKTDITHSRVLVISVNMLCVNRISTWRRWAGLAYKKATGDPPFLVPSFGMIARHLITSQF